MKTYLVTGGAGFIGTNYIHYLMEQYKDTVQVINLDALTYCGRRENLSDKPHSTILEIGCGNGELWYSNQSLLPAHCNITLSDISSGMLASAKGKLKKVDTQLHQTTFQYKQLDCHEIPYKDESFDIVIGNHLLFYLKDRYTALKEIRRVLKPGGKFYCSTYGSNHMKEIEQLTKEYDERIALSEVKLFDLFGLHAGKEELRNYFTNVEQEIYDDSLLVTNSEPLLQYILSCHGNQMQYLQGKVEHFDRYIKKKIGKKGLYITKDAGIFICTK